VRKATWHYWLDLAMGLLALLLALSAFMLWIVFPRGFFAARAVWVLIHKWSGLGVSVAALAHVALHWPWLVRMTEREWGRLTSRLRTWRGWLSGDRTRSLPDP
jgi:hypothetical protein